MVAGVGTFGALPMSSLLVTRFRVKTAGQGSKEGEQLQGSPWSTDTLTHIYLGEHEHALSYSSGP